MLLYACSEEAASLAEGLQKLQSALDVTDLSGQCVYGLHGAVQLLAARHKSVHALWEPKRKTSNKEDASK